jgi:hypothetical protein
VINQGRGSRSSLAQEREKHGRHWPQCGWAGGAGDLIHLPCMRAHENLLQPLHAVVTVHVAWPCAPRSSRAQAASSSATGGMAQAGG